MVEENKNKVSNVVSKILFGFLTFCLGFLGYILWFTLKKNYPEQAKSCLVGSTVGSVIMVLAIVLAVVLPEDYAERENVANTITETEQQQNLNRRIMTEEELDEIGIRIVTILLAVILVGIVVLVIKKFGIAKVFGFLSIVIGLIALIGGKDGQTCRYCGQKYTIGVLKRCSSRHNPGKWCSR